MKINFFSLFENIVAFCRTFLKKLNAAKYSLRIDDVRINKHDGKSTLVVNFSGKFNCLAMNPVDVMNNDNTLACFSPIDIKKIIQLAIYEEQKHDYEIVSQNFNFDGGDHSFTIIDLKTQRKIKINTLDLYSNQDLLSHFMLEDILTISGAFHHIKNCKEHSLILQERTSKR